MIKKKDPLARKVTGFLCAALAPLAVSQAATVSWDGTTGPWTTTTNWDTDTLPTSSDDAVIANGGTAQIQTPDVIAVSRLLISGGSTVTQTGGSISTVPFGTFESPGAYAIGDVAGQTGTYNISGNSALTGGRVRIGYAGGTGTVTVTDTATYTGSGGQDTWLGDGAGSVGSLTLTSGAKWNLNNDAVVVGRGGGTGTLTLSNTAELNGTGNDAYLGDGGGTQSTTTLNDSAKFTWAGTIRVGNGGANSTVTLNNNTTMSTSGGELWVGQSGGTVASLNIKDNAAVTVSNNWVAIGRGGGTGTVTIEGSGQFIKAGGGNFAVGDQTGSTGTLNVNGGTVTINGEMWMSNGNDTHGTVNLNSGSISVNNWVAVGRDGSSNGTLNVNGGTFTKTGNGNFILNGATGTLNQTGGAINVNSGETWLSEGGGKNAFWTATGGTANLGSLTRIGYGGNGTMTIGGTANYTNATVYIGSNASSTGSLTLNGGTFTANHIEEGAGVGTITFNGGTLRTGTDDANFLQDFESGDLTIQEGGLTLDSNTHNVTIQSILTGVGSLTKIGDGTLTLVAANTYAGNTLVEGGTLTINTIYLSDTANVLLSAGSILNLTFAGMDTINQLYIDGVAQTAGTWGAVGSGATYESSLITGTGILLVTVPEPAEYAAGTAALLGLAALLRRRRAAQCC